MTRQKRQKHQDDMYIAGCSVFVVASLTVFALTVWPFFSFPEIQEPRDLFLPGALCVVPSWLAGAVSSRRFGVSGACGAAGGYLVSGVFFFLRLQHADMASQARSGGFSIFPNGFHLIVPAIWVLLGLGVVVASFKDRPEGS